MCRAAKAEYYNQRIDDCGNDSKKMFKITNSLLKGSQERVLPNHECPEMLSNDLVGFFSDKVKRISNIFPEGSDGGVTPRQTVQLTEFQPVTPEQVRKDHNFWKLKELYSGSHANETAQGVPRLFIVIHSKYHEYIYIIKHHPSEPESCNCNSTAQEDRTGC